MRTTIVPNTNTDMDNISSATNSMAGSQTSLPGYDSQSSHTHHSLSDRERGSRSSSVARSDLNSETGRYVKVRKPINDSVASALSEAGSQHSLPPEVLSQITSQITANVLQQLKVNSLPTQPLQTAAMPSDSHDSVSSDISPTADQAKVYTPDSPQHETMAPKQTSPTQPAFFTNPLFRPSASTVRGVSPRGTAIGSEDSDGKEERALRPKISSRASSRDRDGDTSLLEKYWGRFFENDKHTPRLEQFLRGIAMHIIEDYEPKHSLVITPEKMQKYYLETKVSKEFYPWNDIFDERTSSISRMFRELRVEHHLIQDTLDERPDIPALTPQGFATWMTLIVKADPVLESERLANTALHMPISNPDDIKERFPKELPRCLFPQEGDKLIASRLNRAMRTHCHVKLSPRTNSSSESDSRPWHPDRTTRTSVPTEAPKAHRNSYAEPNTTPKPTRPGSRRASYTGRPTQETRSDSAIDDETEHSLPHQPIERERKPYVAQPGGGKNYDQVDGASLNKVQSQPPMPSHFSQSTNDNKYGRSTSVNSNGRSADPNSKLAPVAVHQVTQSAYDLPSQDSPSRHRSGSFVNGQPRSIRNRSPSVPRGSSYARTSGDEVKPGSYHPNSGSNYSNPQWRDPRYERERQDRASFSDTRETRDTRDTRGREPHPRFQSTSNADSHRYTTEEDYYRQNAPNPETGYAAYPPTAYRTKQ